MVKKFLERMGRYEIVSCNNFVWRLACRIKIIPGRTIVFLQLQVVSVFQEMKNNVEEKNDQQE